MKAIAKLFLALVVTVGAVSLNSARAASGPSFIVVSSNGGTVSVTTQNSGASSCKVSYVVTGACNYYGDWKHEVPTDVSSPAFDTYTIVVTPPAGKVLSGWSNPACSDANTTCTYKQVRDVNSNNIFNLSFATPAPKPTPTPTPAPTPTPDPTKPSLTTPIMDLKYNDTTYTLGAGQKPSFPEGEKIVLSGKSFANAKIDLTIYSTPRTASVTADKDGLWTYSLTGLEDGDHKVEAKVTDPASGKTSENVLIATFSVMALPAVAKDLPKVATAPAKNNTFTTYVTAGLALLAVVLIGVGVWLYRRSHKKKVEPAQTTPASEPSSSDEPRPQPPVSDL